MLRLSSQEVPPKDTPLAASPKKVLPPASGNRRDKKGPGEDLPPEIARAIFFDAPPTFPYDACLMSLLGRLFRTKSLDSLLTDAEAPGSLKRTLGPVQLTALGIGAI